MIKRIIKDAEYHWTKIQFLTARFLGIHPGYLSNLILALFLASGLAFIGALVMSSLGTKTLIVISVVIYASTISIVVYKQGWTFPFSVIYTTTVLFIPIPTTVKLVLIVGMMVVMVAIARVVGRALAIRKGAVLNPLYEKRELKDWEQTMIKISEDRYKIGAWIVVIIMLAYCVLVAEGTARLVFTHLSAIALMWSIQTNHFISKSTIYKLMHTITYIVGFLLFITYILYNFNQILLCMVVVWGISIFITLAALHYKGKVRSLS